LLYAESDLTAADHNRSTSRRELYPIGEFFATICRLVCRSGESSSASVYPMRSLSRAIYRQKIFSRLQVLVCRSRLFSWGGKTIGQSREEAGHQASIAPKKISGGW